MLNQFHKCDYSGFTPFNQFIMGMSTIVDDLYINIFKTYFWKTQGNSKWISKIDSMVALMTSNTNSNI